MKKNNKKKLNNKGFSLVELIIVIGIMAILSGALAPQVIKYLDKSRKAADIQTAQTIATAVNAALTNEQAYAQAYASDGVTVLLESLSVSADDDDALETEIKSLLGSIPTPKFDSATNKTFIVVFNKADKTFNVYASPAAATAGDEKNVLYPTIGDNYK
ncbi:MAG: type II secretion system protein [Anaerocolumna sp.]